jgi:NitT/TauT family transport system substrate-binding protein
VCRKDFVAKNPEAVQKLVNTWFDTLRTIKAEPGPTLAIMAKRAGVSEADYKAYDAGTTILTLDQNKQVFKPGSTMQSLPFAAQEIGKFLEEVGLAKTAPPLEGLLQPQFVDAVK